MKKCNLKFTAAFALVIVFNFCSGKNNVNPPDTATVIVTTKLGKLRGGMENSVDFGGVSVTPRHPLAICGLKACTG